MRVHLAGLLAAGMLSACNYGVDRSAPPRAEPGEFTAAEFGGLRWIEGTWRGRLPDGGYFYEQYRFADDSTLEMRGYADSTLAAVSDSSIIHLRGGEIRNGTWVATRIDTAGIHFAAEANAANGYTWGPGPDGTWTATLRNGDAPAVVYRMEPYSLVTDSAPASSDEREVGMRYRALPRGYQREAGYLLDPEATIQYAGQVVSSPGGRRLWLARAAESGSAGVTEWEVRAAADLPREGSGEMLVVGSGCTFRGEPSGQIVAIAEARDAEWLGPVRAAWRLDPRTEAIIPLPPGEVRCPNEGWGL